MCDFMTMNKIDRVMEKADNRRKCARCGHVQRINHNGAALISTGLWKCAVCGNKDVF